MAIDLGVGGLKLDLDGGLALGQMIAPDLGGDTRAWLTEQGPVVKPGEPKPGETKPGKLTSE